MRSIGSYIRLALFTSLSIFLLQILAPEGHGFFENYMLWVLLGALLLLAVGVEICVEALRSVLYRSLPEAARERYDAIAAEEKANRFGWVRSTYKKLTASKPIEEEDEIILDHNYDGIRELDNKLPPWWVWGFYATIVFALVYMARYHIFDGPTQAEEYEIAVAEAKAEIEAWKKTAKDLVDVNTVELLTDASDLQAGKTIFDANCAACHKMDGGGGIGPNLTDDYWILGGGIKNVFKTISEGGRSGKGMISWKSNLKPSEMAQVASYVLSLHGIEPADPKEPEGELWKDELAPVDGAGVELIDSTKIEMQIKNEPVDPELKSLTKN